MASKILSTVNVTKTRIKSEVEHTETSIKSGVFPVPVTQIKARVEKV